MHVGMLAHQFFNGIDGVQPPRPEVLVVPGVFADSDGEPFTFKFKDVLAFGRSEIALLIEDVVKGQQHLLLPKDDASSVDQNGEVDGWFSGAVGRPQRDPGEDSNRKLCSELLEICDGSLTAGEKGSFVQEVSGGITGDGKLRKDDEPCLPGNSVSNGIFELMVICRKIPDGGVGLGERNLHRISVNEHKYARCKASEQNSYLNCLYATIVLSL